MVKTTCDSKIETIQLKHSAIHNSFQLIQHPFEKSRISEIDNIDFVKKLWPLVYILLSEQNKAIYIGETTNALARMGSHLGNDIRRTLDTLYLITSDKFNKSATLDIESFLIKYLSGDGKYQLQNANAGLAYHNYYLRPEYYQLFKNIWRELKDLGIAENELRSIDNSDLFKYSPYKSLSPDQNKAVLDILKELVEKKPKVMMVEGGAGTGKTVLATYLMKLLKTDVKDLEAFDEEESKSAYVDIIKQLKRKYNDPKIALVVPMPSLRKTLKRVFRNASGLNSRMVIGPSEVVKEKYHIVFVDEAHRLRRRVNLTNYPSHDDNNRKLQLNKEGTELDWVLKQSQTCILFYDERQSVKPTDVRKQSFEKLKMRKDAILYRLISQLRVKGGTDYTDYLDKIFSCSLKEGEKFQSSNYEFKLFLNIRDLQKEIQKKNKESGLARLAAGYAWAWKSRNGKPFDIEIEGVRLKWNSPVEEWINSKNAHEEVGCIHTTQGYDLNYAGIIFGKEIAYDKKNNVIVINKKHYHDQNGKRGITSDEELQIYILNIYRTLLCRGINGTYIYVCDENLREYFKRFLPVYNRSR